MTTPRGPYTNGAKIRALRKKKGLSQDDLAARAGLGSDRTIRTAEAGGPVDYKTVQDIAQQLGVDATEITSEHPIDARKSKTGPDRDFPSGHLPGFDAGGHPPAPIPREGVDEETDADTDRVDLHLTRLERQYLFACYNFGDFAAPCIRLAGASDECFPAERVDVVVDETEYRVPTALRPIRKALEKEPERRSEAFFNGPCARLIDYKAAPIDETKITEAKHLRLTLGPVGWYDYTATNRHWAGLVRENPELVRRREYVDLDRVANDRIISEVRLSNILDTCTTLVTNDGYLLYSRRSAQVAFDQGVLTAAVGENIQREKDQWLESNDPRGPIPFRTCARAIGEELSERVRDSMGLRTEVVLGLCFDLRVFHPTLLLLAGVPLSQREVARLCREYPGRDFAEGRQKWAPIDGDRRVLYEDLARSEWVPEGKAAVLRTLEFLDALSYSRQKPVGALIAAFTTGSLSFT